MADKKETCVSLFLFFSPFEHSAYGPSFKNASWTVSNVAQIAQDSSLQREHRNVAEHGSAARDEPLLFKRLPSPSLSRDPRTLRTTLTACC